MEELWSSQCLFYSLTEKFSNFVQARITLDDIIDKNVMQHALDTAIKRFPYFKVRLIRKGEEFVLEDNDKPLLVYSDAYSPTLAPEKNNDYLIRLSVDGSMLNLCFCHAITDGRGIMTLIKTLLHYYFLYLTGINSKAPDLLLADSEIPAEEITDPMLDFKPVDTSSVPMPKDEPPFVLPVESDPSGRKYYLCFTINSDSFMKYSRDNDGSPNALLALFMSHAVHAIHPDAKNIVAGVAIDQRRAFDSSKSHFCRVGLIHIKNSPKMEKMDISTCATCYRGKIILESDVDRVTEVLSLSQQFNMYLKSLKTFDEKCAVSRAAVQRGCMNDTFSVSYVGKQDFGEINNHIRFIGAMVDASTLHLSIEIMSIPGKFFISVSQDFSSDIYVKKLMELLEAEGIKCTDYVAGSSPYVYAPFAKS